MKKMFKTLVLILLSAVMLLTMTACQDSKMDQIKNANVSTIFIIDGVSYDVISETFIESLENNGWTIERDGLKVEAYKEKRTVTVKKTTIERTSIYIELQETKKEEDALKKIKSVTFDSNNFKPSNLRYKDVPMRATPEDVIMNLGEKYTKTEEGGVVTSMLYDAKNLRLDLEFTGGNLSKITITQK